MLASCTVAVVGVGLAGAAFAPPAESPDAHPVPSAAADPTPGAFLAGRWVSNDGGLAEEVWTPAAHGHTLGMFRWLADDGAVRVVELLSIASEEGRWVLRLRHFDAALTPWKAEADGPMVFQLAEHSPTRLVWRYAGDDGRMDSYEQELVGENTLRSTLVFPEAAGREPLVLVKTRS
jgi:hypothetical protein